MMIAVVIPSHNRREKLLRCLASVSALSTEEPVVAVVVLDGCRDGSFEAICERYPEAVVVQGDGSLWWSGSINAGLEAGKSWGASHFLLLNDDVTVHPDLLTQLLKTSRRYPNGLVGSVVTSLENPKEIWCAGGEVNWLGKGVWMRKQRSSEPDWPVGWLPGMGTLIPADALRLLKEMDAAAFPQYFGDTDFSLRAGRVGLPLRVCGKAEIYNETASTGLLLESGPVDWAHVKNVLFSIRSHADMRTRLRFWLRHCPLALVPYQFARFYGPALASILKNRLRYGTR